MGATREEQKISSDFKSKITQRLLENIIEAFSIILRDREKAECPNGLKNYRSYDNDGNTIKQGELYFLIAKKTLNIIRSDSNTHHKKFYLKFWNRIKSRVHERFIPIFFCALMLDLAYEKKQFIELSRNFTDTIPESTLVKWIMKLKNQEDDYWIEDRIIEGVTSFYFITSEKLNLWYSLLNIPEISISKNQDFQGSRRLTSIELSTQLPYPIRIFDYSSINNHDIPLTLPPAIKPGDDSKKWINHFKQQLVPLMNDFKQRELLNDHFLKLLYGFNSLECTDLLDACIQVPPLTVMIEPIQNLLKNYGKAEIFTSYGMGRNRVLLYLIHWWIINYPSSKVLYINTKRISKSEDWNIVIEFLESLSSISIKEKYLLIIDNIQSINNSADLMSIYHMILRNVNKSYVILLSGVNFDIGKEDQNKTILNKKSNWLREDIFSLARNSLSNFTQFWPDWQKFIFEWLVWISEDIFQEISFKRNLNALQLLENSSSPYELVNSFGILENQIQDFQRESSNIQQLLYSFIIFLFKVIGSDEISLSQLQSLIRQTFIVKELGDQWEKQISNFLEIWTHPMVRLLPPFMKQDYTREFYGSDILISSYHKKTMDSINKKLEQKTHLTIRKSLQRCWLEIFPNLYTLFKEYTTFNKKNGVEYLTWIKDHARIGFKHIDENEIKPIITSLNFSNENLSKFPESIAFLTDLKYLNFSRNNLKNFPNTVKKLESLLVFDLSYNNLTFLPSNLFETINLQVLNLNGNQLKDVPESIASLSRLRYFGLSRNNLENLPEFISKLSELEYIDFSENKIKIFPRVLTNLKELKHLNLKNNQLKELSSDISNITKLEYLNLSNNVLMGLNENFTGLSELLYLNLNNNCIKSLPENFINLTRLKCVNLSDNPLSSLPESLIRIINIQKLVYIDSQIYGYFHLSKEGSVDSWFII